MTILREFLRETWCRIAHGHVMQNLGDVKGGKTLWMCARCLKTEALHTLL